jgi:hypothetical protein
MTWTDQLNQYPMDWLLEEKDPGVRYLAMRDILDIPEEDPVMEKAREAAYTQGPIAVILSKMQPEGYWEKPGGGYSPKYQGTVWSLISLAQMGASIQYDQRIRTACTYYLDHAVCRLGYISYNGTPSGTFDCLQGNMIWSLLSLGCTDPRLDEAADWMARFQTGEGIAPFIDKKAERRYYAYESGPAFMCGANSNQACAWGAVKVILALGKIPPSKRTPAMDQTIQLGLDFFLGIDPLTAAWPTGAAQKPSGDWWKLGFPVFYITDLLQAAEALAGQGYGNDPRLAGTIEWIRSKQNEDVRWMMEFDYTGKTWVNFGLKKKPNKWVTLRAMRLLKKIGTPLPK